MMTMFRLDRWLATVLLLTALLGFSCSRNTAPPPPLAEGEVPGALQKAFAKAKPEFKELADQVIAAAQAKDYSKAYLGAQSLASKPGLNKEQLSVASRAALTLNGLLQSAQAQGDTKAAETLKTYRIDK